MTKLKKLGENHKFDSIAQFTAIQGSDALLQRIIECNMKMLELQEKAQILRFQFDRYNLPFKLRLITDRSKEIFLNDKLIFMGHSKCRWIISGVVNHKKWEQIVSQMNKCGISYEERAVILYFEARRAELEASSNIIQSMAEYYKERYLWCITDLETTALALPAWMQINNTLDNFKQIHEVDELVKVCAHSVQT